VRRREFLAKLTLLRVPDVHDRIRDRLVSEYHKLKREQKNQKCTWFVLSGTTSGLFPVPAFYTTRDFNYVTPVINDSSSVQQ
jgi:hypothetical protein